MNIYLSAVIHIKENYMMDGIELLKKLVIETRRENGCIQYDLFEDHRNKGVFFIHETWATSEDLHSHQVSDHMMKFREGISSLLEKPNTVYTGNKLF
ncbi:antibiotic biosynthesis monooxygenase [Epilithonimonas sp. JDS]|uniref:putative quinol monooxygenase n=1 Tax=Epilithonimonas sp. JDS TaxID=2902797 RepID=UPI001E57AAC5|nr:putative quinol monooxygenase [Epilithonimonas sp. JDS]MCD9854673.1 antibiotic biosynthesis monooxygenase [Epilithonimonas sp. JDS]